jgi:hypothetical protein
MSLLLIFTALPSGPSRPSATAAGYRARGGRRSANLCGAEDLWGLHSYCGKAGRRVGGLLDSVDGSSASEAYGLSRCRRCLDWRESWRQRPRSVHQRHSRFVWPLSSSSRRIACWRRPEVPTTAVDHAAGAPSRAGLDGPCPRQAPRRLLGRPGPLRRRITQRTRADSSRSDSSSASSTSWRARSCSGIQRRSSARSLRVVA